MRHQYFHQQLLPNVRQRYPCITAAVIYAMPSCIIGIRLQEQDESVMQHLAFALRLSSDTLSHPSHISEEDYAFTVP